MMNHNSIEDRCARSTTRCYILEYVSVPWLLFRYRGLRATGNFYLALYWVNSSITVILDEKSEKERGCGWSVRLFLGQVSILFSISYLS